MAQPVNYFNFVGGLNTESNPLTYPENTVKDADNCIFLRDGSIRRRYGIDYEVDYEEIDVAYNDWSTIATNRYEWRSVAGAGNLDLLVIQIGSVIYFFDSNSDTISANKKAFTINLEDYKLTSLVNRHRVNFTSGKGRLFIAGNYITPLLVTYNVESDTISVEEINIKIRDFEDLEPTVENDLRPTTLTPEHAYWLRNAGWLPTYTVDGVNDDPITFIYSRANAYPSKADVIYAGKKNDDDGDPMLTWTTLNAQTFGNTPAPQGHYIVDAFRIDRSAVANYTAANGLPVEAETTRPSCVAFMAGRVFFGGLVDSTKPGNIYFSQIIEYDRNIGRCYQEQDPTAEEFNELVDTDGGVITIPDSGPIRAMHAVRDSIVVLADNGVWQISGVEQHFTAKSYRVFKVSSEGVDSYNSVVIAGGDIYYLAKSGLLKISQEQISEDLRPENISYDTVQTYINDLTKLGRRDCIAGYEIEENRIYWLFPDDPTYPRAITKILVYDMTLEGYYPLSISISDTSPKVYDAWFRDIISAVIEQEIVTVNSTPVTVDGDTVYISDVEYQKGAINLTFMTLTPDGNLTFSQFIDGDFLDWETATGGTMYNSYFETGHQLLGDAAIQKQIQYLVTILKRTEDGFDNDMIAKKPSSCFLSTKWDWSNSSGSNKWSTPRQVYRYTRAYLPSDWLDEFDTGFEVIITKSKIRGRGRSLRFRFESDEDKNFHIYGWQAFYASKGVL
jgi:hypothetical protein